MSARPKTAIPDTVNGGALDAALAVQGLHWTPRGSRREILHGVDLSFAEGRFVALLGPNGAGKTTLLRLLLGFLRPSAGQVLLDGRPLVSYSRGEIARALAYLPQQSESRLELPAREIIRMGRYPYLKPFGELSQEDERAVDEAIRRSGAAPLLERSFATLSGGERQRVLCARAMAVESRYILLDEPVANLDLKYQHATLDALRTLSREQGTGLICVMHDVNLAAVYADAVVLLKEGQLFAAGNAREVLRAATLSAAYDWPMQEVCSADGKERFFVGAASGQA